MLGVVERRSFSQADSRGMGGLGGGGLWLGVAGVILGCSKAVLVKLPASVCRTFIRGNKRGQGLCVCVCVRQSAFSNRTVFLRQVLHSECHFENKLDLSC